MGYIGFTWRLYSNTGIGNGNYYLGVLLKHGVGLIMLLCAFMRSGIGCEVDGMI